MSSKPQVTNNRRLAQQRGYTIVELMIAIALGLILVTGLTTIFVNNSRTGSEIERANQQIENGRYAMQVISDDLRNAGYLGEFNPFLLGTPAAKPDPCTTDVSLLKTALPIAIQGYDNDSPIPTCLTALLTDLRGGTDILVVRRASTCAIGDTDCDANVNGATYFQASACSSPTELSSTNIANYYVFDTDATKFILHQKDCATAAPVYRYRTHIYFIANNDKAGDGIPTLKRAELGVSAFTIVPLVEGIQELQIEYGLDTTLPVAGTPAAFTADPDTYGSCTGVTCVGYWRNTVAAKISLLARNTQLSTGYQDNKTYTLGLKANGQENNFGPFNDGYKRHLYQSVVRLNNIAGRNAP